MPGAWWRRLAGLGRDRRGIAAVEFALVLPVMILFSLGIAEVGRFALLALKLQHAANTMADLAARDEQISEAALQSMFSAMPHVMQPFDIAAQGVVIVSCVGADGGPAAVAWQRPPPWGRPANSEIGAEGGDATLPEDLVLRDGEAVVVAEAVFRYTPWLLALVPETVLRRTAFFRPRLTSVCNLT
jgi:hypothetical protein